MFLVEVWLRQKYHAPQVRSDRGLNLWPRDHDSAFHVTDTPAFASNNILEILCVMYLLIELYSFLDNLLVKSHVKLRYSSYWTVEY